MSTNAEPVDRLAEIERLAALEPIDYEVTRVDAAEALSLRAHVLDKAVASKRRELGLVTTIDEGQGRAVVFADPLPWHEPVNGDELASGLTHAIKTYAVLRDEEADAIAFWILHTWLVRSFTNSPRLAVKSPTKGCGKTTILRLLDKLAKRPKRAGSISPPALFRAIEMFQPTLLLDENEKYLVHGGDLHALINEGHCNGATVMRVLGDKLELREFSIFGALAFARNGKVPDDLEQRSIVIVMQRRKSHDALQELRDDRCEPLTLLARKCARWSEDNVGALIGADPDMGELINRNADNWRPLFAIADVIGRDWPENIRKAAAALVQVEADSMATQLLADIRMVFDTQKGEWADRVFSERLAHALADIEGSRWAEYGTAKKPITKNELARLLKPFKIAPAGTVRVGGETAKGYKREQFEDAWSRYLQGQGVCETSQRHNPTAAGTSGPFPNVTEKTVVTDEKCEKSLRPNDCDVVTFQNGENALARDEIGVVETVKDLSIPGSILREAHHCEQCHGTADGTEQLINGHTLHRECARFWHQNGALA